MRGGGDIWRQGGGSHKKKCGWDSQFCWNSSCTRVLLRKCFANVKMALCHVLACSAAVPRIVEESTQGET